VTENGVAFGLTDVPKPGPGQVLVKVVAAAQNLGITYLGKGLGRALKAGTYGGIVGRDFAGTVVEIGPDVSEGVRSVGERVAGFGVSGEFLSFARAR